MLGKVVCRMATENLDEIARLIEEGELEKPDLLLDQVEENARCARWHYLKGLIFAAKGWSYNAQVQFEKARYLDPGNEQYRSGVKVARKSRYRRPDDPTFNICEAFSCVTDCFICCSHMG